MFYQNPHIYTKTKEYFNSKDVFSFYDIKTWLKENEEEYNKIYEGAERYQDKLPTEEYKFEIFYQKISRLKEYHNRNVEAKSKLEELQNIFKDEEKLKEWLIRKEEDYYSFWEEIVFYAVKVNSMLVYSFREVGEVEHTKILLEKNIFEYSYDLSILLNELYPNDYYVYDYWEVMKNKVGLTFNSEYLKPFTEKDTFSFKELSAWLEENEGVKALTGVKYTIYEKFESAIAENIEWALRCELEDLQELIKIAESVFEFKDNQIIKNLITAFGLEQPEIKNKHLLLKVVNEVRKRGTYAIYAEDWLMIEINGEELAPLIKLVEEFNLFDENEDMCPF